VLATHGTTNRLAFLWLKLLEVLAVLLQGVRGDNGREGRGGGGKAAERATKVSKRRSKRMNKCKRSQFGIQGRHAAGLLVDEGQCTHSKRSLLSSCTLCRATALVVSVKLQKLNSPPEPPGSSPAGCQTW
jgi:hypothetical protein